jgi:hypothetical protein
MDRHLAMETFVRVVETGSFSAAASLANHSVIVGPAGVRPHG